MRIQARITVPIAVVLAVLPEVCGQGTPRPPQMPPRDVMYRILFNEIVAYQNQADLLVAQAKSDRVLRSYHQNVLQLSSAQATQLIEIAQPCVQQVQAIDAQADTIIKTVKDKYRRSPGATVPALPLQLSQLESQRKAVILSAVNSLAAALGPAQFSSFEGLVQQHVASGLRASAAAEAIGMSSEKEVKK